MRITLYVLWGNCFLIYSCNNPNYILIKDLSRDTVFLSQSKSYFIAVTTLDLRIKGFTDDTCIIENFKLNKGSIDTIFKIDWYSDSVAIAYKAYKAKKGKLEIWYKN